MTVAYYQVEDNVFIPGRWFLNGLYDRGGTRFDSRDFTYGKSITAAPRLTLSLWNEDRLVHVESELRVSRRQDGMAVDFTYADGEMPVVRKALGGLLGEICGADLQRFPVVVDGADDEYEIVNVVPLLACIDTVRSDVESWWVEKDKRPDKLGHPRSVRRLVIDADRVGGHHIFRIEGWSLYPVVSDVLKDALEREGATGITFLGVS